MHALWSQPAWTTGSYCHNFADSPHKCKLRAPQSHPLHVQSVIRIYRRLRIRAQIFAHIVIENSQLNAERKTKKKGNRTQYTFIQISQKLMLLK